MITWLGAAPTPRLFALVRDEDETGVSGTGHVADGVQFPNGKCAVCWRTATTSTAIYDSIADVEKIHGHGGEVKWLGEAPLPPPREVERLGASPSDSLWAYDAVFLWNNSAKRWDREFGNMYQSVRVSVEACDMGTPDGFPFWNDSGPPYRVWVRWSWENNTWKHQQTESNWKAGPHTCYGG